MVRLLSVLKGEAMRSIESIGMSCLFHAVVLISLKRDFDNQLVMLDLKLKLVLDKPQRKDNNRAGLRTFQHELKCSNSWLVSMDYHSTLTSTEHVTKAVPNFLKHDFYRHLETSLEVNKTVTKLQFKVWLEKKLKLFHNPIPNIMANRVKQDLNLLTATLDIIK